MDEQNKQEGEEHKAENTTETERNGRGGSRPHVHLFGAEVNGGEGDDGVAWTKRRDETKEEWRKRKDEWKQQHHEQREQWRMQHREWRDERHHGGGGVFWGIVILLVGVVALFDTMGLISHSFWHVIAPFWPILLILWGASIILGRHWFTRFVLFLFTLAFLIIVIIYGLIKTDSPLVSSLSPTVVSAIQNSSVPQ